jgi:MFS family permease
MRDRHLLFAAAFVRALATGMAGVLLGLYLAKAGFSAAAIGGVLSAGLIGATLALLLVTSAGDRLGRRRCLVTLAAAGAAGSAVVALASGQWAMICAAFFGMLNGMGRDRGAALVLEQAMLPATTDDSGRTQAFAWYNLLADTGHAAGALLAALPELLHGRAGIGELDAFRASFILYALLLAAGVPLYLRLSEGVESPGRATRPPVSHESRRILVKISALFAVDSVAGGFLGAALLSYFFFERFGVPASTIGALFFAARVLNALSHLAAAWLAGRIGLVNTMVLTHIPSSVLLATVAIASDFTVAAVLFLIREGLVEMDVPTRQSYVMAVVRPHERTVASGVTHLVRLSGWAVAPGFAGWLMQAAALGSPLFIGAGMKIAYDLMLWRSFRRLKPPEEINRWPVLR